MISQYLTRKKGNMELQLELMSDNDTNFESAKSSSLSQEIH